MIFSSLYSKHKKKSVHKWSSYLDHYDRYFYQERKKPISLLEIGVQSGGSLELWGKYFVNATKIIGCDIDQKCASLTFENPVIEIVVGDANSQSTKNAIIRHAQVFDIIIDDGSHMSGDIVRSFLNYFPLLCDGGIFVAEDLHASYWNEYGGGLYYPYSSISFFKRLTDIINYEHWGVERTRIDILNGFTRHYQLIFDEAVLEQIHSIEFSNSLCFVRKKHLDKNGIGKHIISGNLEIGNLGHRCLIGEPSRCPVQSANPWSQLKSAPDEDWLRLRQQTLEQADKIEFMRHAISSMEEEIKALYGSTSWKITQPFRRLVHLLKRLRERHSC